MHTLAHWFKLWIAAIYWFVIMGRWRLQDIFNDLYGGHANSETFRRILHEVFGDEHAAEADPTGFLTVTDLRNLVEQLHLQKDQKLVDLACGRGGAGLSVARATGAQLVGVDISEVAVKQARGREAHFGVEGKAEFRVGDIAATGLPSGSFDGAMSVDALYLVPDKAASIVETARILKPGARFACTTWELHELGGVKDYRPLLESAGFRVESYEPTPNWERYQRGVHERVLAERDALIQEMGEKGASFWIQGAQVEIPKLSHMRRILFVATRL
jgi:SAM-dependent methyltransferase